MTDYEQAQLVNYISNAELTDGFEYGFQKLGMGNLGSKLGEVRSRQGRIESFENAQSDVDSL
jgi:hypothetical protein